MGVKQGRRKDEYMGCLWSWPLSLPLVVNLLELLRSFVKCESELPAQGQSGNFICEQSLRGHFPRVSSIGPWL